MRNLLFIALVVAPFASGCGDAEEAEKKLAEAEKQAAERIAKVEKDAKAKIADAEKQLEAVKTELAEVKAKFEDAEKAKESAEEQAKLAEAALAKARQAFKDKAKLQLADLNKEFAEVGAKASKVPAKTKAAFTKALQDVKTQQQAVAKDIAAFDTATLDTFKAVNAKLATDLAVLKSKIRAAKAKIPA